MCGKLSQNECEMTFFNYSEENPAEKQLKTEQKKSLKVKIWVVIRYCSLDAFRVPVCDRWRGVEHMKGRGSELQDK